MLPGFPSWSLIDCILLKSTYEPRSTRGWFFSIRSGLTVTVFVVPFLSFFHIQMKIKYLTFQVFGVRENEQPVDNQILNLLLS